MGNLESQVNAYQAAALTQQTTKSSKKQVKSCSRLLLEFELVDEGKWSDIDQEDPQSVRMSLKEYFRKGTYILYHYLQTCC